MKDGRRGADLPGGIHEPAGPAGIDRIPTSASCTRNCHPS